MQKINLKKTTKEQMLTILEKTWQENEGTNKEIAALSKRIEEQNDALAKCVAEKNELREQLKNSNDTMGAVNKELQRVNDELRCERGNVILVASQRDAAIAESKDLRTKLAETEATLERANSEMAVLRHDLTCEREASAHLASVCKWISNHPWRNLWAWFKLLFS